jgi:hypothetical protein
MSYGEWREIVWDLSATPKWNGKTINGIRIKPWAQIVDVDYHIDSIVVRNKFNHEDKYAAATADMGGSTDPWNFTGTTAFPAPGGIAAVSGQNMQHSIGSTGLGGGFDGSTYNEVVMKIRTNDSSSDPVWYSYKNNNWWGQLLWDYTGRTVGPQFTAARSVFLREDGTKTISQIRSIYPSPAPLPSQNYWGKIHRTVYDRVVMGVAPIHHSVTGNSAPLVGLGLPEYPGTIFGEAFSIADVHSSGVDNIDRFPSSGAGMIDQERIKYDTIAFLDLGSSIPDVVLISSITRGVDGTVRAAHDPGAEFIFDKPGLLHSRSGKAGLFVSISGQDAATADDGDLIFDSTAPDFMQVLAKGTDVIPVADLTNGVITPFIKKIETSVRTPYDEENATVRVTWNSLVPNSNVHPDAYPQAWGTSGSTEYVTVPPYLNMDHLNLSNPALTGSTLGYSLTARTVTNPRYIVPGDPVLHSAAEEDGRAEPDFNPGVSSGSTPGQDKIIWSNTSHIFITDTTGGYIGTVTKPGDSTNRGNCHSPTFFRRSFGDTDDTVLWCDDGLTDPGGYGNTVIYRNSISSYGPFTLGAGPTEVSNGHTNFHPHFYRGPQSKKQAVFVKGLKDDYTILDELNASKDIIEEINHRPSRLYMKNLYDTIPSDGTPDTLLYSAGFNETISNPKWGPPAGGKNASIVFTLKGDSVDSFGKIMIIDDYSAPEARQVSPSYLDCSHPTWSSDGSKILFSAANPTRRLCLIDAGTATTPVNPYSLVELNSTVANSSAWFDADIIVSDYLGKGANTDVSGFNKGFGVANTVDIIFTNGSPYKQHIVSWSLYRMKGT